MSGKPPAAEPPVVLLGGKKDDEEEATEAFVSGLGFGVGVLGCGGLGFRAWVGALRLCCRAGGLGTSGPNRFSDSICRLCARAVKQRSFVQFLLLVVGVLIISENGAPLLD